MKKKKIAIIVIIPLLLLTLFISFNGKYKSTKNRYQYGDIGGGILFNSNTINFNNNGMSSKNVQNAIDELYQSIDDGCLAGYEKVSSVGGTYTCNKRESELDQDMFIDSQVVKYSNNVSGLNATNVKAALDEIAVMIPNCKEDYTQANVMSDSYECKAACIPPTDVVVGSNGVVTWTGSSNANGYEISIDGTNYTSFTSGDNYNSTISSSVGNKTVYVRSTCNNTYISPSTSVTVATTVYNVALTAGTGIASVTGAGNYISGASATINATTQSNYTWSRWQETTGGTQVSTSNPYTFTVNNNVAYTAQGLGTPYTLNYNDNLFAARTQQTSGVLVQYTENGSYLTLNGTMNSTSITDLWGLDRRTFVAGEQYNVTINYVSGSLTCADSTACTGSNGKPYFVMDLALDGNRLSDRQTSPQSFITVPFPVNSTPSNVTLTVGSTRTNANGLQFWIWQGTANNAIFNNYKVQILVTKVHSKTVNYNGQYGTLETPTKTGYDFNGWYTAPTGGTQVTSTATYTTSGDQTLYAQWSSHRLLIQYNGNGSDTTFCSTNSSYSMDSDKYEIIASSRNVQSIGYGQFVSYGAGLDNYNNTSYTCFARTGYTAPNNAEWVVNGTSSTYGHNDTSVTAIALATAAGCNLTTSSTCTVRMNVNWVAKIYKATLNNQSATTAGTTEVWYHQGRTKTVNGVTCYYYTNSSLTSCLANGYTLTKPTKSGYAFDGYFTETNGGGTQFVNYAGTFINNLYTNEGDRTLYAKWTPYKLTLKYHVNGGTITTGTGTERWRANNSIVERSTDSGATWSPISVVIDQTTTSVNLWNVGTYGATKTGYTIVGTSAYNTNSNGTGANINQDQSDTSTSNPVTVANINGGPLTENKTINMYIKWVPATYTITLNNQSATTAGTTAIYEKYNTGYYLNSGATTKMTTSANPITKPEKTGHTFGGYFTGTNGSGTKYIDENGYLTSAASTTNFSAAGTLYAKWTANNYYLDLNGRLDGSDVGNIAGYGTCDVYVNGTQVANDVTDYYAQHPYGSTYSFSDCKATTGHTYGGAYSGSMSGTIGAGNVATRVSFTSNTYTVTLAGVNPINTSFDNQTVTLAGNVAVPVSASSTLALSTNTNYVVSFDYKCASGTNQFDVDFYPDSLPQTNPTATTSWQHMDWVTSSSNSAMGSCQIRFFDDFQGSGETDITITNIMLSRTSTKSVTYGSTYGSLTTPSRSGYSFVGWYTAQNGGTKVDSSTTVTTAGNHTLYARWSKTTVTYTKKTYNCQTGTYSSSASSTRVQTCSGWGKSQADAANSSSYWTCDKITGQSVCEGAGLQAPCYWKNTYARTGCSTWKSSPETTETGLTQCTPSQDFLHKVTCE